MDTALVRLEDVHRTYRLGETEVPAVRGVTLELRAGELTALVGPSGSGKSTLLNLVGCIDAPDSGRVLVEGVDVATLSDDARSRLRNRKIAAQPIVPELDNVAADRPVEFHRRQTSHLVGHTRAGHVIDQRRPRKPIRRLAVQDAP